MDTTFKRIDSMFVYSGSCGAPVLVASAGRMSAIGDSLTMLNLTAKNLSLSATYYLKIKLRENPAYAVNYRLSTTNSGGTACNYIVNGDFENLGSPTLCLTSGANNACFPGVQLIPSWESGGPGVGGTVFSPTCSGVNAPSSSLTPHSGNFLAAIDGGGYGYNSITQSSVKSDDHKYLRTTLSSILVSGKKYYVQMFYKIVPPYASDGLGMYLSNGAPTMTNTGYMYCYTHISPTLTPQIDNPPGNLLTNTNWAPMAGIFTGGGEDHLTIGNFRPASLTTMVNLSAITQSLSTGGDAFCIDDISITPVDFSITPVSVCVGMATQLNPTACTPPYCTSTYTWLPATGLSNASILNPMASPSITTTYTLIQQFTNASGTAFTNSAQVTVTVTPATFSFAATTNNQVICTNQGQSAVTYSMASNASPVYTWYPGALLGGSTIPLNPTVTTTYTVYANNSGCILSQTAAVVVSSACCTSTAPAINIALVSNTIINGPRVINQDLTIGGNAITDFQNGEFLIAPNVKITVLSGSQFELRGAHLYGCSTQMWQGIEVQLNARLSAINSGTTGNCTLIEDAITAVNINNINSVPSLSLTEINGAIFNKNYISISVNNGTTNAVPIFVQASVFTSRTLTFTSTSWPNTGTVTPGLRTVVNATTGLVPPYTLQSATYSNLKSPYSSQPAQIGIKVTNVGNTTGWPNYGVQIGQVTGGGPIGFNLFDGLGFGIYATNSNIYSTNNVFQNMKRYTVGYAAVGGTAIYHACNSLMNTELNMDYAGGSSLDKGNQFWNCYRGVDASNVYKLSATYAVFRSTQSYTAAGYQPGNTGIYINSNRFNYNVANSVFNNINYCININLNTGPFKIGAISFNGINGGGLNISDNYFGPQPSSSLSVGSTYINNAVNISSTSNYAPIGQYGTSVQIKSNNVNRAFHGITLTGMNSYPAAISTNSVTLLDDQFGGSIQHGIELAGSFNGNTVLTNTLSGTGTGNTQATLIYSGNNLGTSSPSICCNMLSNSYNGFEFNNNNSGTVWKGNQMNTHVHGMLLSANAMLGIQGASLVPTDNQWTGGFGGTSFGTWTDQFSDAANAKLWIKTGGAYYPTNSTGYSNAQSYGLASNLLYTSGAYTCGASGTPPPVFVTVPGSNTMTTTDMAYAAQDVLFRYLVQNDSLLGKPGLYDFYSSMSGSSIDQFQQAEVKLYNGLVDDAMDLVSAVSATNTVESNYKSYYQLYANYTKGNFKGTDSSDLASLAGLCPGANGNCVYQARGLYSLLYKTVGNYNYDCSADQKGRHMAPGNKAMQNAWDVALFPNPAAEQLTVVSSKEQETLEIDIKDFQGRSLLKEQLHTNAYSATLELNLTNGVYLISIKNNNHESITKKLVIAR